MLCEYCSKLSFQVTTPPKTTYYRHHPSIGALKSSAQGGCRLCFHIFNCLGRGETPKQEGKRSPQIWIKVCPTCTPEETMRYGILGESLRVFCGHGSLDWQDPDAEADCYLDLASVNDAKGMKYMSGRLIAANPTSKSTLQMIQSSIAQCSMHHPQCRPSSSVLPFPPTRLIDVGTHDNPRTKLIHTTPAVSELYVALSYCWGTGHALTTTQSNIHAHTKEIPLSLLPRTIKDAIIVTRSLGIQFLWVDALCIIQDSDDGADFQRESANMGSIYGHAYVTIAAENSESCADGFLHPRSQGRAAPVTEIPIRLQNGSVDGSAFICEPIMNEQLFLMRRAWAFQEQRLSRRVLHYRSRGVDFCCRHGTWPESIPLCLNPVFEHQTLNAIRPVSIFSRSQSENHRDWLQSVEVYSNRSMTQARDKLPAISGYAHELHKSLSCAYVAGIWERYLAFGLLWVVIRSKTPVSQAHGTKREAGPSWSWVAIQGPVSYHWPLNRIGESSLLAPHFKLLDHMISLTGLDPMGEVSHGRLTLSGALRKVSWLPPPARRSGISITSSDTWHRLPDFDAFQWGPFEGGKCLFDIPDNGIPQSVWCFVVSVELKAVNCLVLRKEEQEAFSRLGIARLRRVRDMAALLASFHTSTITIV